MNSTILSRNRIITDKKRPLRRVRGVGGSLRTGPVTVTVGMIIFLFILGVWYLYQEGRLATKGYEIQHLQQQADQLQEQHRKLERDVAKSRSIKHIEESATHLNMVSLSSVAYIHRTIGEVAILGN